MARDTIRMEGDELALRLLLGGASKTTLARAAASFAAITVGGCCECPACGDTAEKQSNGDASEPTALCLACGHQWSEV